VVVELQREHLARVDHDALGLEPVTVRQHRVGPPRPVDLEVAVGFAAAGLGELREQALDLLGARPVRHEHRIRGFHDHQVLHAQGGHQALRGMQVAALGVQGHHVAHQGIAVRVFRGDLVEGFPRSQVVPIGRKRHDTRPLRMLHDGVID